jgi:hypothetical protein
MKWNSVLGSMVVALGLCAQSFGFDLLDRMLGANGYGCQTSCCTAVAPSCAAPSCAAPTCAAAAPTCAAGPTCAAEPSCGAVSSGCCQKRCCGLHLGGWLGHHRCCKPVMSCGAPACAAPTCAAAPACGAEPSCGAAPACGSCHRQCFVHRLFACKHRCCNSGCNAGCASPACAAPTCGAEPACGINGGGGKDLPPMPPMPEVTQ